MKYIAIMLALIYAHHSPAQTVNLSEAEGKIREIERNVSLVKFQIEGRPNATLQERMKHYRIQGLSVAVIKDYKVEWVRSYGWADSAERRPVTPETLFEPGSISKSLNALGVLKLVKDKRLELDRDMNDYLVSWKFPYDSLSKGKKINVGHLLSHTAGLGVHGFPGYFNGDDFPTILEILDGRQPANTEAVRSLSEPGLQFLYSGGGVMLSQLIVMEISKQPYDQYMYEHVLNPLGMTSSFFTQPPPKDREKLLATGYTSDGKEIRGKYPIMPEQAAAGLWTSPGELCKFIIDIQLSLKGRSNKVLTRELTKRMLMPHKGTNAALGFFIDHIGGAKYFQHSGVNQGFSGQYYGSFEDGNGLVIFVNSEKGQEIIRELVTAIARVYRWKGFYNNEKPVTKRVLEMPHSVLKKYTGIYKQGTEITSITEGENCLWYNVGSMQWKVYFSSEFDFFNLESRSEKTFYKNREGKIAGFVKRAGKKKIGQAERIQLLDLPDSLALKYAGTYMDGSYPLSIIKKDNYLWFDYGPDQPMMKMNFFSPSSFYMDEDFGAEYEFMVDAKGRIGGIFAKAGKREKTIRRII